ncbi:MAG: hypothetical protein ACE147_00760 [Candidatus Methylomirabilales bacterium]
MPTHLPTAALAALCRRAHVSADARRVLAWLVGAVQQRLQDLPPGERADLRFALTIYAHLDPGPQLTELAVKWWAGSGAEDFPRQLTDQEAQELLRYLESILRAAARRERITAPSRGRESEYLEWNKQTGRYFFGERYSKRTSKEAARVALWRQLAVYGHLIRECPAPARRGKVGETCGLLFMAKRPDQEFCSSTCRSRAGVRKVRDEEKRRRRMQGKEG